VVIIKLKIDFVFDPPCPLNKGGADRRGEPPLIRLSISHIFLNIVIFLVDTLTDKEKTEIKSG